MIISDYLHDYLSLLSIILFEGEKERGSMQDSLP
jgi:hypothetical protein